MERATAQGILERINAIQRELEQLKREVLASARSRCRITSLYGAVPGADISDEMIEDAKRSLFRDLKDL
jgi:protein tyrosine phosphatase (PTP) superfamily phosphohydrolase (DUF442 family)